MLVFNYKGNTIVTKDLFKEYGLSINKTSLEDIEIGKSYPVYGMITKFIDESYNNILVEVNFNIKVKIILDEQSFAAKFNILKERSLEPGIFMITFETKNDLIEEDGYVYEGICNTVIFGKKKELDA
jgi:hypothetical protein